MRVLVLNWRCTAHPRAGGAEVITLRLAEFLVQLGHEVTWFTSAFRGALPEDQLGRVRIVRRGTQATVRLEAFRWYRDRRSHFDLLIDEVNTLPFLAHLYSRVPVVALFPQVAR